MSNIRDWNDLYVEIKRRAEEVRGSVELTQETSDLSRWPRTRGADVIAIGALVDPHVNRIDATSVRRRWQLCMLDVWRYAIAAPAETYVENRAFWSALLSVCVYLSSRGTRLPSIDMLTALLEQLGDVLALRNVGPRGDGPFQHFDGVKTFHDLYLAQARFLRERRGVDRLGPEPGVTGPTKAIPRTTNDDVVLLADYWTPQLANVRRVIGHAAVATAWKLAVTDVDRLARRGNPNELYAKNNAFWRALLATAVQVSVADEAPTEWDMFVDSVKGSIKELPSNIAAGAKKVASEVGTITSDLAHGVGKIANDAGRGLFSGFGTPLLIGGGLLGWFLISRSRNQRPDGDRQ